jgi:23S rRNA (pseudouridine1915-N3)-methyltransferase
LHFYPVKIVLLQVDKTHESYISEGISVYSSRLINYTRFEVITISVPKAVRQRPEGEQKASEWALISEKLSKDDQVVLLDENGTAFSSEEFAGFIRKKQNSGIKCLVFIIGGPYGFDQKAYDRAQAKVSLSRMTFSHQMVRLFFAEQLYRAFTILKGEKYHHK